MSGTTAVISISLPTALPNEVDDEAAVQHQSRAKPDHHPGRLLGGTCRTFPKQSGLLVEPSL